MRAKFTDGSDYDTLLALFSINPVAVLSCDNNSGPNGKTSSLNYPLVSNNTYLIEVDGVNGAIGNLSLNYSLVTRPALKALSPTQGMNHVQVIGHPAMHFTLQQSTNLLNWTSILTTNSPTTVFDYMDAGSAGVPGRFYRALMLP